MTSPEISVLLFANTSWYLYNFRLSLAEALREQGWSITLMAPEDEYSSKLQEQGFAFIAAPISRSGVNPLRELAAVWQISRLYRRVRPTIAHHFTIKPVIYGSLAARWSGIEGVVNAVTGLGYVFTQRGSKRSLLRPLVAWLYRFSLRGERFHTVFQNEQDRQAFLRMGLAPAGSSHLIPGSGVDLNKFKPSPEPEGPIRVLLASRMLRDKGVVELVEAARMLKREGFGVEVVLAGRTDPGNPSSLNEEQLLEWEAQGAVKWLGHVDDMPDLYASSHIVTLPSYREGLSRTLIEAAASGRPIVASDVPGCREVVEDGSSGLLVPVGDPAALARALKRLADDRELRAAMGARARAIAERNYSIEKVVNETLDVYERALGVDSGGDRGVRSAPVAGGGSP